MLATHDTFEVKFCYNWLSGNVITVLYAFIWFISIPLKVKDPRVTIYWYKLCYLISFWVKNILSKKWVEFIHDTGPKGVTRRMTVQGDGEELMWKF